MLAFRDAGLIAFVLTLAIGFLPFAVLSIWSGTFWLHSRVAVPLFMVPSVLLGDSLLLPIFNRRAVPLLISMLRGPMSAGTRVWLASAAVVAFLVSIAVSVWLHGLWASDKYTGFVDPVPGQLSAAGKWHLVFSILQMTLVLWFLLAAFTLPAPQSEIARAWIVFVVYTILTIGDFAIMHVVIAPQRPYSITDLVALLPFPSAVLVYALLR